MKRAIYTRVIAGHDHGQDQINASITGVFKPVIIRRKENSIRLEALTAGHHRARTVDSGLEYETRCPRSGVCLC
jgi:hypothetical protein